MKQLKGAVILYDQDCPLCRAYTTGFVRSGMLERNGRMPYQNMPPHISRKVDKDRYTNEIALVNIQTGEVNYGVESLFVIIANSLPALKPLFRCKPFAYAAGVLYRFISYNRRAIVPPKGAPGPVAENFAPAMHRGYRTAYLLITWFLTAWLLHQFNKNIPALLPAGPLVREWIVCGGQIIWQGALLWLISPKKTLDYLGNMMTISFAGSVLLTICAAGAGFFNNTTQMFYLILFFGVVTLMFVEHLRRCKLLRLGLIVSVSWILYRLFFLIILL